VSEQQYVAAALAICASGSVTLAYGALQIGLLLLLLLILLQALADASFRNPGKQHQTRV